jgi:release factor glutamine methyltransferase
VVGELRGPARDGLPAAGSQTPRLDAEVLLMASLGWERAKLFAHLGDMISPDAAHAYHQMIERRAAGEPVAYITGRREFRGLDFLVDRRVLIPRPETERLVEWGLEQLRRFSGRARVVDVGTGSGAIAVSLAREAVSLPTAPLIVASDRDRDALRVAARNVERLAPGAVQLIAGDVLDWARPGFDLILANLPYLRPEQANPSIAWEPPQALYASAAGFALSEALLRQASTRLAPGGALALELDPGQRELALAAAREAFPTARVAVEADLAGLDRYLFVELPD